MYLAKGIAGADELREFAKRVSNLGWAPSGVTGMNRPEMAKAMAEMYKTNGTMEGLPLLTILSVNGGIPGMPAASPSADDGSQSSASSPSSADAAAAAMAKLGGLGGMIARRKQKAQSQDSTNATPPANSNPGALMEITMEVTSYSIQPVDPSLFQVPEGFKKTDTPTPRGVSK
jgi:hypothetical protein